VGKDVARAAALADLTCSKVQDFPMQEFSGYKVCVRVYVYVIMDAWFSLFFLHMTSQIQGVCASLRALRYVCSINIFPLVMLGGICLHKQHVLTLLWKLITHVCVVSTHLLRDLPHGITLLF
jgi:hypothetical protein